MIDQQILAAQRLSRDEIHQLQSQRLRALVRHVYDNVPFYRRKMDERGVKPQDIRTAEDIDLLPFTEKSDLRDHYPFGLLAVSRREIVRMHASSGTTGKPTVAAYTREDLDNWTELTARSLALAGIDDTSVVHIAYGYGLFTGGMGVHYGAERLGAAVVPASGGNTQRQLTLMEDFGATALCCTPSYAINLAEAMQEKGVDISRMQLKTGVFGAEPWTENMRKEIERMLDIKAYDIYGLSEIAGPGVAFDCECQCGLHINEDFFYPEIIDPETGKVLPDGEVGELVFTCIGKEALPLIRYRTRDIASLTHEKCACGRTLVRMTKPKGRSDDMLIIRGINVFPSQVEHVLTELGLIPNYQIVVDRKNNLDIMEVKVELADRAVAFFKPHAPAVGQ